MAVLPELTDEIRHAIIEFLETCSKELAMPVTTVAANRPKL